MADEEVEAIKASDLMLLMKVVEEATGLYNELERARTTMTVKQSDDPDVWSAWLELGDALRALGLQEAT